MKKIFGLVVVICGVLLLTACGESKYDYVCTAKMEEQGENADVEFGVKLDNNEKVKNIDLTIKFDNGDTADALYDVYHGLSEKIGLKIDVSKSGKKVIIKNYEKLFDEFVGDEDYDDDDYDDDDFDDDYDEEYDDDDSIDHIVGLTKKEFKRSIEQLPTTSNVSCK